MKNYQHKKLSIMKNAKKILVFSIVFLLFLSIATAQTPPHPNGGNDPGSSFTPVCGGASIGSGKVLLTGLAATLGCSDVYKIRKRQLAD